MPCGKSRANFFHVAGFTRILTAIHSCHMIGDEMMPHEAGRITIRASV
jgi:hypothetical protein